jgi:hypothetical protein
MCGKTLLSVVLRVPLAIVQRRSIKACLILIVVACVPSDIAAPFSFSRYAILIALAGMPLGRHELPLQFIDLTVIKLGSPVAITRAFVSAGRSPRRCLVDFTCAVTRCPIAIPLEPIVIVVLRIFAKRFVRTIVARAGRGIHLAPGAGIAKIFAALSSRSIRLSFAGIAGPLSVERLRFGRVNDSIEPVSDRHAGRPRGSARIRTEAFQIPWTARFHFHVQSHAEQYLLR